MTELHWLSDDRYAQLKSQMTGRFVIELRKEYPMHGYIDFAPGVANLLMHYVEESWDIIRGQDKPLPEPSKMNRWGDIGV